MPTPGVFSYVVETSLFASPAVSRAHFRWVCQGVPLSPIIFSTFMVRISRCWGYPFSWPKNQVSAFWWCGPTAFMRTWPPGDWSCVRSDMGGCEVKYGALDLPVDISFYPHLWSQALIKTKKKITDASSWRSVPSKVPRLSLRDRVEKRGFLERLRVEPLLLHVENSQLRWHRYLVRTPLCWGVPRVGEGSEKDPGHVGGTVFWMDREFLGERQVRFSLLQQLH